ncbi:hypothetical protein ABTN71_19335, partial [Acinetobacter baumannii]
WSHALRTPDYADAAVAAFREIPGRFVLGYGNYLGAPWAWSADPAVRRWIDDLPRTDLLGLELAFDVPDSDDFPERAAFDFARDRGIRVTTHAGVW